MQKQIITIMLAIAVFTSACDSSTATKSSANNVEETDPTKMTVEQLIDAGTKKLAQRDFDGASDYFYKALHIKPDAAIAYNMLGMTFRLKNRKRKNKDLYLKEVEAFQKAIEIEPEFWVAIINLGETYHQSGHKGKAIPLFIRALELNPEHRQKKLMRERINAYEKSVEETASSKNENNLKK